MAEIRKSAQDRSTVMKIGADDNCQARQKAWQAGAGGAGREGYYQRCR
jgi:hypothetical protein